MHIDNLVKGVLVSTSCRSLVNRYVSYLSPCQLSFANFMTGVEYEFVLLLSLNVCGASLLT